MSCPSVAGPYVSPGDSTIRLPHEASSPAAMRTAPASEYWNLLIVDDVSSVRLIALEVAVVLQNVPRQRELM